MEFACNVPSSAGTGGHKDHPYWAEATWQDIRTYALACEDAGYDTIAFPDHFTIAEGKTFECFSSFSALAELTDDVSLYPKVTNALFRNPGLLAKIGATLDVISEGRLKMGMGAGWVSTEMKAYGYDWPDPVERIHRMEEAIAILDALWTQGEDVDYAGEFYELNSATCRPTPVQSPRPPIAVGGGGERYTLAVVARWADSWNWFGPFDDWSHKYQVLAQHCQDVDRDLDEIETSWFGRAVVRETEAEVRTVVEDAAMFDSVESARESHLVGTPAQVAEQVDRLADMGIDEVVVEFVDVPRTDGLTLFADEIAPDFQ